MKLFDHNEFDAHEQVSFYTCAKTGLKAIIAVHNTHLGPALGGCRMWNYASDEEAINDVLRLSRGMTYKAAMAGLPLGGGKSVILGDPSAIKTPEMMQALGVAVETFSGRYIVAEDVGTTAADMGEINKKTRHVVGLENASGDPSPVTAFGVFTGLKAAVQRRLHRTDLNGLRVSVQGLGNVGMNLCRLLAKEGAVLTVTDISAQKIEQTKSEFGAQVVELDEIYDVPADVFAPCALGAVINDQTLDRLKATVVAGAANNQLAQAQHGEALRDKNILYAPDYVINAGGLINVYHEYKANEDEPYDRTRVLTDVEKIAKTLNDIFDRSEKEGISTARAADLIAQGRFQT